MTPAITALAFTVVLAEVFTAVGLSTVAPAMFVQLCRLAKAAIAAGGNSDAILENLARVAPPLPGMPRVPHDSDDEDYEDAIAPIKEALSDMLENSDNLQLLVPSAASIDAEFSCGGSESYSATAGAGGVVKVVNVNAAFSSMFELHASTTVRLHVDFAPVEYTI